MDTRTLCLGVLTLGDATGYQIRKQVVEGPIAHFYATSFGSIYPALGRLLKDGLVTCTEPGPPERPGKKVYRITEVGRHAFRRALTKRPGRDRIRSDVMFMLFFAEHVEPEHLVVVYDAYLESYRARLALVDALDDSNVPPARLFVRGVGRTFYRGLVEYLERNRPLLLGGDGRGKAAGGGR